MTPPLTTLSNARAAAVARPTPIPHAWVWLPLDRSIGHGAAWDNEWAMADIARRHPNALGHLAECASTAEGVREAVQGGGLVLVTTEEEGMTKARERSLRDDAGRAAATR